MDMGQGDGSPKRATFRGREPGAPTQGTPSRPECRQDPAWTSRRASQTSVGERDLPADQASPGKGRQGRSAAPLGSGGQAELTRGTLPALGTLVARAAPGAVGCVGLARAARTPAQKRDAKPLRLGFPPTNPPFLGFSTPRRIPSSLVPLASVGKVRCRQKFHRIILGLFGSGWECPLVGYYGGLLTVSTELWMHLWSDLVQHSSSLCCVLGFP